jgi:tetrahydromethanopterin S-methyltransferase subunit A
MAYYAHFQYATASFKLRVEAQTNFLKKFAHFIAVWNNPKAARESVQQMEEVLNMLDVSETDRKVAKHILECVSRMPPSSMPLVIEETELGHSEFQLSVISEEALEMGLTPFVVCVVSKIGISPFR